MTHPYFHRDLPGIVLGVLFIGLLISSSLWILMPFLSPLIWASTIVIATWPLMTGVQALLFGKRGLATTVMALLLLLVLILPFLLAVSSIISHAETIVQFTSSLASMPLPAPPDWLKPIPLLGPTLTEQWQQLSLLPPEQLQARLAPYAEMAMNWFVTHAGGVGMMIVQFFLTVILSCILYMTGESVSSGLLQFAHRLAGQQGRDVTVLAARAIRSVALGIVVTALIQSVLGGLGLAVCGVPAATMLTAIMFVLCIAQIGTGPVLMGATVWLFYKDQNLWGAVLLVWTLVVVSLDNLIRPILIKKGADLPLLLIFAGVLGGLVAFGIIGLFIGPVVLAVTYTLLEAWVKRGAPDRAAAVDPRF